MAGNFFKKGCIYLLLVILPVAVFSQTRRIDSLTSKLRQNLPPAQKLQICLALCNEQNSLNPDTLNHYALMAKNLAEKQHDAVKVARTQYFIAAHILLKGKSEQCLKFIDLNFKQLNYTGEWKENYISVSLLKARALSNSNKPEDALNILFPLLTKAEKDNDILAQIKTMSGLVNAYVAMGLNQNAMTWAFRGLRLFPQKKSLAFMEAYSVILSNIGVTSIHLFENTNKKMYRDTADIYITQVLPIVKKYEFRSGLAYNLALKGTLLGYNKENTTGEQYLKESLALYKQIGNMYYTINAMSVLGNFYHITNQPLKGIAICKEGIELSKKYGLNIFLYRNLADNYSLSGNYPLYAQTLEQLNNIKDSLYARNSADASARYQAQYQLQKKENTIIQQKLNISRKNNLLFGIIAFGLIILIIGFVYFQNNKKNQQLKLRELELEQKNKTTRAVIEGEEKERKRIAAELHDSVAQKMVVAKLNIEALQDHLPHFNNDQQNIYDNILSLVDESCAEVRNISHTLMPQAFFKSGLTDALKNFIDKIDRTKLFISFNAEGRLDHIGQDKEIMIYRIVQECIQNVIKHAKASRLDISLIAENNELDIIIEDNGIGFNPALVDDFGSMGMLNIRSRIEFLNGKIDITSQPGAGSVFAFYIPIN